MSTKKLVLFDRDGTLNEDQKGHTHRIEDFKWIFGAPEAIIKCKQLDLLVIVVSNQSGIAKGLYTREDVEVFHRYMNSKLPKKKRIDDFFYCPHHPQGVIPAFAIACRCRKPNSGLIEMALKEYQISPRETILFGNSMIDIQAGARLGIDSIQFKSGSLFSLVNEHLFRKVT